LEQIDNFTQVRQPKRPSYDPLSYYFNRFECFRCNDIYRSQAQLERHIELKHVNEPLCPICNEFIGTKKAIKKHKNEKHSY